MTYETIIKKLANYISSICGDSRSLDPWEIVLTKEEIEVLRGEENREVVGKRYMNVKIFMEITVNMRKCRWDKGTIDYEEVVTLAGKDPKRVYTVTYSKRGFSDDSGSLVPGSGMSIKPEVIFEVTHTGNA